VNFAPEIPREGESGACFCDSKKLKRFKKLKGLKKLLEMGDL
jgi:hypothetical protein